MESIPQNPILSYRSDTLEYLRKQYGFDTVKRVNDAIDVLEGWIAKQEHFEKKSFDRDYLERLLICNKGSVEKCKKKLDKLCTLRTLVPECFSLEKIDKDAFFGSYSDALLNQMTPDHGRVHFMEFNGKNIVTSAINNYCYYFVLIYKYLQFKDYSNHVTFVANWKEGSVMDFLKALDVSIFRKCVELAFEGFSMRIKALHMVTNSRTIDAFVAIMKSVLSEKIGGRIKVHKSMESVYEYVPKELFPQEHGGKDKPLVQLREDLYNELYSKEFTEYRREMNKARTNEAHRQKDKFNEEYLGMSGTFRVLSVD